MIDAKNLTFLQFAAELRVKGQFCDIELNVKDSDNKQRVVMAHKIIMMYYSSFLNHLMSLDSRRKSFQINRVTYAALLSVVKLLYREMSLFEFTGSHSNIEAAQILNIDLHDKKSNIYLRKFYTISDTIDNIEGEQPSLSSGKIEYSINDEPSPYKLECSETSRIKCTSTSELSFNNFPSTLSTSISEPVFDNFPTKPSILEPVFNDPPPKNIIPESILNASINKCLSLETALVDSTNGVVPDPVFSSSPTKEGLSESFQDVKHKAITESAQSHMPNTTNSQIWPAMEGIDYSTIIAISQTTSETNSTNFNECASDSETTGYDKINIYQNNTGNVTRTSHGSDESLIHVHNAVCPENRPSDGNTNCDKVCGDEIFEENYNPDTNTNRSEELLEQKPVTEAVTCLTEIDRENRTISSEEKLITDNDDDSGHSTKSIKSKVKLGRRKKGPFQCDHCDRELQTYSQYERHLTHHTGEKPFTCGVCGKSFNRKGNLVVHEKIHENLEKKFQCELCDSKFYNASKLKHHIKHVHVPGKNEEGYEHVCQQCDRKFKTIYNLKNHIANIHDQDPVECHECGVKFQNEAYLRRHQVIHTDELPYKCKFCDQHFKTVHKRSTHVAVAHLKEKYICEVCGNSFNSRNLLTTHTKRKHGSKNPRQCPICSKVVSNYYNHMRMHRCYEKGDVFTCKECGKTFPLKIYLHQHMNVHKDKEYKCEQCGKYFTFNASLQSHVKTCKKREQSFVTTVSHEGGHIVLTKTKVSESTHQIKTVLPRIKNSSGQIVLSNDALQQNVSSEKMGMITILKSSASFDDGNNQPESVILDSTNSVSFTDDTMDISPQAQDDQHLHTASLNRPQDVDTKQKKVIISSFSHGIMNSLLSGNQQDSLLVSEQEKHGIRLNNEPNQLADASSDRECPSDSEKQNQYISNSGGQHHIISSNPQIVISTIPNTQESKRKLTLTTGADYRNTLIVQGGNVLNRKESNELFVQTQLMNTFADVSGGTEIEDSANTDESNNLSANFSHEQQEHYFFTRDTNFKEEHITDDAKQIEETNNEQQRGKILLSTAPKGEIAHLVVEKQVSKSQGEQGATVMTDVVTCQGISQEDLSSVFKMTDDDSEDVQYVCILTE